MHVTCNGSKLVNDTKQIIIQPEQDFSLGRMGRGLCKVTKKTV